MQGPLIFPNQDCLSRSVTSLFAKELVDYEIPNIAKLPNLKTYNGTTDPDSHIDTYEWTMTSLELDKAVLVYVLPNHPRWKCRNMVQDASPRQYLLLQATQVPISYKFHATTKI